MAGHVPAAATSVAIPDLVVVMEAWVARLMHVRPHSRV